MTSPRELAVYRRASLLADKLGEEIAAWPSFERWTVGIQLIRAADSIGANIAEAYGRERAADQRRLLYIARGSILETEHWLDRAEARRLPIELNLCREAGEVGRMLNGLIRSHRNAGLRTEN